MAQIKGFDISVHQGHVNWDLIQQAYNRGEIGFVILRAGYGGGGKDGQFPRNLVEARRRGIPRQFYFFAYPGRSSGAKQAQEFRDRVGALQPGESVSLDMEDEPTYGRRLVPSDVNWAHEFLNTATALFGVRPLIYMNSDVLGRFDWSPIVKGNYGLWIANYGPNNGQPNGKGPSSGEWPFWAIWQYTSKANVAGISPLDMNIFSGDKAAFLKYGKSGSVPTPKPQPKPTPQPQPKPAPASGSHTVKAGETLSGIAARYGTDYKTLARINAIRDPNKIYPGQVIKLSGSTKVPAARFHTVVRGDNLSSIAKKYGTSWQKLQQINGIKDANRIYPGQRIRLP